MEAELQGQAVLRDYARWAWRRRWAILVPLVLVPLGAVLLTSQRATNYRASAQVLINQIDLPSALAGRQTSSQQAERAVETQAGLARAPIVLRRTVAAVPEAHLSPGGLARSSTVAQEGKSDLLTFLVRGRDGDLTPRLVNAYAHEFTRYSRQLHNAPIAATRAQLRKQLGELEAAGQKSSPLYQQLAGKAVQLEVLGQLQPPTATIVRRADGAAASRPDVTRAALIGIVLGAFLGVGLGLLWDLLAPRVRAAPEEAGAVTEGHG